jgi:hypothetical protein
MDVRDEGKKRQIKIPQLDILLSNPVLSGSELTQKD